MRNVTAIVTSTKGVREYCFNGHVYKLGTSRELLLTHGHKYEVFLSDNPGCLWDWDTRHGKPYQHDIEAHVNNYRAKPRNFEGDMNLAMILWCENWSLERDVMPISWEVSDIIEESIIGVSDANEDKPAQAICRAAVIVEIRKRGEK